MLQVVSEAVGINKNVRSITSLVYLRKGWTHFAISILERAYTITNTIQRPLEAYYGVFIHSTVNSTLEYTKLSKLSNGF
jgi:hypothetical protein